MKNNRSEVLTWGWNSFGQLGDGTTIYGTVPYMINQLNIAGTSLYYFAIQNAYDVAVNSDSILIREGVFNGDLLIDRDIAVTLEGGYGTGFSSVTGDTLIYGDVVISNGAVVFGNIILE